MREDVDRLKGKVGEVRKQVSVRPKNRVEGGKNRNGVEQDILNNFKIKNKEGTGKQNEWIKVKGGSRKKVENPKDINVKNRFTILDQSNI